MSEWEPSAGIDELRARAALLAKVRAFMSSRSVLEVDTPSLGQFAITDPNIELFEVATPDGTRFLQSSPEYAMKRLLASGSGDIFQLGKVFRSGEHGGRHNPEFVMLEWYRIDWTHYQLMREVAELIAETLRLSTWQIWSLDSLLDHFCQINLHDATKLELKVAAENAGIDVVGDLDKLDYLDLLMTHVVEPGIASWGLVFIVDFLEQQAALSRIIERGDNSVAARFEAYVHGIELANGYWEESDPDVLMGRFEADNDQRVSRGQPVREIDERLISASRAGVPDCAGVAVGFDRLLMLARRRSELSQVMPFSWPLA
ncbi:MAG: EF-P lysine aminoacylase EpmA [Pseudomonadota bacterium]|nr:EF-P lysine aminoacylase EpmA [Pseudomonadota bacterium]